jgi:hypothetical protein
VDLIALLMILFYDETGSSMACQRVKHRSECETVYGMATWWLPTRICVVQLSLKVQVFKLVQQVACCVCPSPDAGDAVVTRVTLSVSELDSFIPNN